MTRLKNWKRKRIDFQKESVNLSQELTNWLLLIIVALFLALLVGSFLTFRFLLLTEQKKTETLFLMHQKLMDKSLALISTKEAISFQAIQAMNSDLVSKQEPVDNSDHAEMQRWIDDDNTLSDFEKGLLREASV